MLAPSPAPVASLGGDYPGVQETSPGFSLSLQHTTLRAKIPEVYSCAAAAFCLMCMAVTTAGAQVSLPGAVDLALRNSTALRIAEADRAHALAALSEVKDAYIPALTFGSGLAYTNAFPIGDPSVARLTAQSLIFNFSQRDNIRAARAGWESSNLSLAEQRQQVILDTTLTYSELAVTQDALHSMIAQGVNAEEAVKHVQQRQNAGLDAQIDVKRAQLRAAEIHLKHLNLSARAAVLRQHLTALTGIPLGGLTLQLDTLPTFPAVAEDDDDSTLPDTAVGTSPAVKEADRQAAMKQFQYFAQKRVNWRPEIDFVAQYGYFSGFNNYSKYYQPGSFQASNSVIGVQITVPLFNRVNNDRAREARADSEKAMFQKQAVSDQVRESTVAFQHAVNQTAAAEEIARLRHDIAEADAQTLATEAANGSPQLGASPITPQQVAEGRLAAGSSYVDFLSARLEHIKAELNLLKMTGQLEIWVRK